MARREARPRAERERVPRPLRRCCPDRGRRMPIRYEKTAAGYLGVLCLAATLDWLKP